MVTILQQILATKRAEIETAKLRRPMADLERAVSRAPAPRDFFAAVTANSAHGIQIIAEIKKASPSAGLIVQDFDPVRIARTYADHGAAGLSVLTDETYFQARLSYIDEVRRAVDLPILRKDFLIDEYQVHESRAGGADAILLIAAAFPSERLVDLFKAGKSLGMTCLVEVHSESELREVLGALGSPAAGRYLLGINNRDLHQQRTDLTTTTRLAKLLPVGTPFISESGIVSREDVVTVQRAGACAILVGESLLRAPSIAAKMDELFGRGSEGA